MHEPPAAGATEHLHHVLDHVAHLLPVQGPIGVFIHHNTLHAFQHLPFEEAVLKAADIFGAQPYMTERAYRDSLADGRIRLEDLDAVIEAEGVDPELRRLMLVPGIRVFHPETVRWRLDQDHVRTAFRTDLPLPARRSLAGHSAADLFDFWHAHTKLPDLRPRWAARPRDGVLHLTGSDTDEVVHPFLIRLAGAFLDQGLAYWPMPDREQGFWRASIPILNQTGAVRPGALKDAGRWAEAWSDLDAGSVVVAALGVLGVEPSDWQDFIQAELLALPGWAGLMRQLELDPSLAPHERVPASLLDFLAVRLLLTVAATSSLINPIRAWRVELPALATAEDLRLAEAATLFDASQLMGLTATLLSLWTPERLEKFHRAVISFDDRERRRIWHLAYERRHERLILLPLRQHAALGVMPAPDRLAAQIFFCIDEREESIRRHLEEIDPEIETLSAAGFFGIAMNYTGIDDAHGVSLCPVVVKPAHAVAERPVTGHEETHQRRVVLRRAWGRIARHLFLSSRTLVRGWLATTLLGVFSIFPLAIRVLSPRRYLKLTTWLNSAILPEPRTELAFMRSGAAGHHAAEGLAMGFTTQEKIDRVAAVLAPAGLTKGFARLVVILGHGSTSLNNPHESAHDCGACGGRRGGPNARIFAAMANRPDVRRGLRERGILIPDDTWFVGGYHDTCNDDIDLYDLENLPASHAADLDRVRASLDLARAWSAHERARRFEAANNPTTHAGGLHHVQERAEHLAEPRPEYGHCTNAVTIVGRRASTRGLFFDRRAFLVSYDATSDPDNTNLARLLGAVIPVCAGISLEYYFSFVDNERYGCGTKLPHNVTGLVGVMNGFESDLRTGLPWQMVEIHEPVRNLFVLETTPDRALETIRANPLLWEFLDNRWIRLATVDPIDGTLIHAYRGDGRWERIEGDDERLYAADSSRSFYQGRIEHLPVARINPSPVVESPALTR